MKKLALAVVLALCAAPGLGAHAERADLAILVEQHPDDPNLAWALARELFDEGQFPEAATALAALRARWPGRFQEAAYLHGLALLRTGDLEPAHQVVSEALASRPNDPTLGLLNAAILLRLTRDDEAHRELERIAQREPAFGELADRLSRALVREDADPRRGDAGRGSDDERALHFEIYGGAEFDTNANLDNDSVPGPKRSDWRIASGASLLWRALRRDRLRIDLGYRYDREDPIELTELARERHRLDASALFVLGERTALALDADASATLLDRAWFHAEWRVRPSVLVALGARTGLLRVFAEGGQTRFEEDPLLSSLDRDAAVYGGGFEHVVPVPGWEAGWLSLRIGYARNDTDATADPFGFEGAFDHHRTAGRLRLRGPLTLGFVADASVGLEGAWYDHDNVIEAFASGSAVARRDTILWSRLSLIRPVTRFAQVEVTWRHFDRASNVGAYDVRSDVVGAYITLIPW